MISIHANSADQCKEPDSEKIPETWVKMLLDESFLRIDAVFRVQQEVDKREDVVGYTEKAYTF